ncbi:3-oxoacyl-ACP synthase III family protein [Segniliparus rugosus]|uniref:3-oxoacyl-ACP synthase n=1 Tax=Segniliparus rugosus (strain ATCC BAA-974 / DSM 45345 / CCUG 50838 / CIP 108380 / JCM 13579 / CDC 945) TaxID=679197 RepID=E5XQL8_SEGRC|nr:hypothetical protein HMPREF9336_01790 [Segniliparus rugosus ATCC BAA-974]
MKSRLESIGSYLPSASVSTEELLSQLACADPIDLARISGVQRRRVHSSDPADFEDSYRLATLAARDVLAKSRHGAADLDMIISCSIARGRDGEYLTFEPSFALALKNDLGATGAVHFDVSNACAGMFTGVMVLDRLIRSGAARRGMVVSGEYITAICETALKEISHKYDPQFASLTVGDSAVAVILEAAADDAPDGIDYVDIMTCAEFAELCIGMPSDKNAGIALYTDNRAMHNAERYKLWTTRQRDFLAARGSDFAAERYDFIIHHQFSGPAITYINQLAAKEFGAEMPESLTVLEEYGNTASTANFLVLHEHMKRGVVAPGSKVLLVPAASGVVAGYLCLTVGDVAA